MCRVCVRREKSYCTVCPPPRCPSSPRRSVVTLPAPMTGTGSPSQVSDQIWRNMTKNLEMYVCKAVSFS